MKLNKKGAMELSVGTIVVIVLAMTMLILGIVFIRTIMCGAIGLTGEMNKKVEGELNRMFGATGGEVVCIGGGEEPVSLIPGRFNNIYCRINAPETARYDISIHEIRGDTTVKNLFNEWMVGEPGFNGNVPPGDEYPKRFVYLNIPTDAPAGSIIITINIRKDGGDAYTQQLIFEVKRLGWFRSAAC